MANGVVHPVIRETITKYKQLIADPITREVWEKAMCKELGRLPKGYRESGSAYHTKGTKDSSTSKALKTPPATEP